MSGKQQKRRLIIDTDCGVDDAIAILMCLSALHKLSIEAITTSTGNTKAQQAAINVGVVLDHFCLANKRKGNESFCEAAEKIPIYSGASSALVPVELPTLWDGHGADGLGGSAVYSGKSERKVESQNAVLALIDLANKFPNQIDILVLGPMTNLALASRLDPTFPSKISKVVFMGGCMTGRGNSTLASEFNINFDPEAAWIVFESFKKLQMVSWELTLQSGVSWDYYRSWLELSQPFQLETASYSDLIKHFIREITSPYEKMGAEKFGDRYPLNICDGVAAAVLVDPEFVVKQTERRMTVELTGKHTRGMTVIDWDDFQGKERQVEVIEELSLARWVQLLDNLVQGNYESAYA